MIHNDCVTIILMFLSTICLYTLVVIKFIDPYEKIIDPLAWILLFILCMILFSYSILSLFNPKNCDFNSKNSKIYNENSSAIIPTNRRLDASELSLSNAEVPNPAYSLTISQSNSLSRRILVEGINASEPISNKPLSQQSKMRQSSKFTIFRVSECLD